MNSFRHIFIALLCLLAASNVAQAQNDWDSVLDRYEAITARCVELRAKVAAGEKVPQKSQKQPATGVGEDVEGAKGEV